MVIDFTNSSRYYSFDESAGTSEFQYPGKDPPSIFYRKVKLDCLDGQKHHSSHTSVSPILLSVLHIIADPL